MNDIPPYLFFYSANFAFILTNIYGWILKAFYRAKPYRDNYDNLFPSQNAVAVLYLVQVFEIPYLLMIGEPKALVYVNTFSILLFSSLMVVMCEGYFFLKRKSVWYYMRYFLPMALIVIYLLLAALELVPSSKNIYRVMFWVVIAVFLYYIARLMVVRRKLRLSIRKFGEELYSNSDDFPALFAQRIEWLPIAICALMFVCFLLNDVRVKMWRDIFFTFVNVWFMFYTLNPHRKGIKRKKNREEELEHILVRTVDTSTRYKLSEERCKEIEYKLIALIETEKPFLDSHLTLDQLSKKLGVNRNYISEVVARSKHGSFYTLISSYRLEYAQEMLRQDPTLKIEHVAFDSGFSSMSLFSQVFKRYKGVTPSTFAKRLEIKK